MSKKQDQQIDLSELIIEHDGNPSLYEHLKEDFQDLMSNKEVLRDCILKFIDQIVDQLTLEIDEDNEENNTEKNEDLAASSSAKTSHHQGVCPNCTQTVASLGFARHLAKCMGIRISRHASRRAASNKEKGETSKYTTEGPSDDDDEDWNPRKNKKRDKNGGKKSKGSLKKSSELDSPEAANVDVEGTSEDDTNPRLLMIQNRRHVADLQERRSRSSSPSEGPSGSSGSPKKRDKSKKKSKGKERGSPSTSLFD